MKTKFKSILILVILLFSSKLFAKNLDAIREYVITASVNQSSSVTLNYHIKWEVLDSTTEGPLTWVKIGIPNEHYNSFYSTSKQISKMSFSGTNGSYLHITLDRKYYAGEIVNIDFVLEQDYLYKVNKTILGYTDYQFTPGWFNDIDVDYLQIKWKADKVDTVSPDAILDNGYYIWSSTLPKKKRFTVNVTYPNDAFYFNSSKDIIQSKNNGNATSEDNDTIFSIFFYIILIISILFLKGTSLYFNGTGFGDSIETKVTRKIVKLYPVCTRCGTKRDYEKEYCKNCGKSMIKSETSIKEKDLTDEEKIKYKKDGKYQYDGPDTFLKVKTIITRRKVYTSTAHGHGTCAHSSCACACACACAGGGRAGCSTKDFYKTNLKLKNLYL